MVAAAVEVYRLAPKDDPQIAELLVAVAKHYAAGEASAAAIDSHQRRRRLRKGACRSSSCSSTAARDDKRLPVWGFLSAFATNDYDLAETYLKLAEANGVLADPAVAEGPGRAGGDGR